MSYKSTIKNHFVIWTQRFLKESNGRVGSDLFLRRLVVRSASVIYGDSLIDHLKEEEQLL